MQMPLYNACQYQEVKKVKCMQYVLEKIIQNKDIHAKWLNTLSYLEFMGTRKIARSASQPEQSEMRLRHLAEEARHAHFFKMMIPRLGVETCHDYELGSLFCGLSATRYFNALDASVKKENQKRFKHSNKLTELSYLYVTTLIEERAGDVYVTYDKLLQKEGIPIRLTGIIGEEDVHLKEMNEQLSKNELHSEEALDHLRKIENDLFDSFYASMIKELGIEKVA